MIERHGGQPQPQQNAAYILSLNWPKPLADTLNGLREAFFPAERNHLAAHLTLFHALPGAHLPLIQATLAEEAANMAPCELAFVGPISLGNGVALRVKSAAIEALRARLVGQFKAFLTPQDAQGFRGHVTVQNKVSRDEARRTLDALTMAWNPNYVGQATGLHLARYAGGPWEPTADYAFARVDAQQGE